MPAEITRLVTTTGIAYEKDQPWPGMQQDNLPPNEQIKVRLITFLAEDEKVTTEGDDEEETDTGSVTHPAQYEIWGLNDRTYGAIQSDLHGKQMTPEDVEYISNLKQAFRRTVYVSSVDYIDEQVDISSALKMVELRMLEWWRRSVEEEKDLGAQLKQQAEWLQKTQQEMAAAQQSAGGGQNGQPATATTP